MFNFIKPTIKVKIAVEPGYGDLPLPHYQTSGSAGMDLYAAIDNEIVLNPGEFKLISSGIRIALPKGYEAQIRPRSGLALKHGISIVNSPGTIDSDYRGVVGIILINFGEHPFIINKGDRIAQMIIQRYKIAKFVKINVLPSSTREDNGFGSTGKK